MDIEKRCNWVTDNPLYIDYHDNEWGIPVYDDKKLFECLTLEGAQAGLSWYIVLKKREDYRKAFEQFNIEMIAEYDSVKIEELVQNKGIIRHRGKIESVVANAKAFIEIQKEFGSFSSYIWSYVNNEPQINHWEDIGKVPKNTPLSDKISKDLKKRGFKFVGTTIVYSFLQAVGIMNDHIKDCKCSSNMTKSM